MNKLDYERLQEIQQEMLDLLDEAKTLIRQSGNKLAWERAKAYWLAHVEMGLTNEHGYLGGASVSFDDTLNELEPYEDEDEFDSPPTGPSFVDRYMGPD